MFADERHALILDGFVIPPLGEALEAVRFQSIKCKLLFNDYCLEALNLIMFLEQ